MRPRTLVLVMTLTVWAIAPRAGGDWQPADNPLMTRWAKDVSPDKVHAEYPRPQMVRDKWQNLNGLWQYAITPREGEQPEKWAGDILVPFAVESALSGVKKEVGPENALWYRRTFRVPDSWKGQSVLLHFGAVDWEADVWVNDTHLGTHRGGYTPFDFDITKALRDGDNTLVVRVWDPADANWQPHGKQVRKPGGIWYTSVTGIWQTVWLEPVPRTYISALTITPDLDHGRVHVKVNTQGVDQNPTAKAIVQTKDFKLATASGPVDKALAIDIPDVRMWSPDDPFLYNLSVVLEPTNDAVTGYFAMRKVEVRKDADGFNRLFLNNRPLFMFGPLDQGWWPDGLYTAPTDEALRYDIEVTKKLGMNMARKHVKVEPDRWYYWCDKLGLMVWQDMPSGDRHIGGSDADLQRTPESAANYFHEWGDIIDARRNHPCIVAWVPFNEGWGQFDTDKVLAWTKDRDPTRLVDGPSGWTDRGSGDMRDVHSYPGPGMPTPEDRRAAVLGEFGGLGLPLQEHLWWDKRNWGYRNYKNLDELRPAYDQLIFRLRPLVAKGLAAAVYTQTTDVEGEVNGLMTYDRAVIKLDAEHVAALHAKLYQPPPIVTVTPVAPTSEGGAAITWRYTTVKPADDWAKPDFDDSAWEQGPAGFGEPSTPGSHVRTKWKSNDIWLRRTFTLDAVPANPNLRIHHDEDAQVYLNGTRVAELTGFVTEYFDLPLDPAARAALRAGANTLAVHCHQTGGGQYIDAGLIQVTEQPRPTR